MYPFLFVQINQTVSPSSVGICSLRHLIAVLVFVIVITSKYYVWAKIRRQDKENKNKATKSTKTNTAKTRLPLAGGDDIKCQTVDQHQGEICKMRVLTAKRAQNTLAYVCMHIFEGIFLYVMPAPHTDTHTVKSHSRYPPPPSPAITPLNLGADLAFAYAFCMSRLCRPIGMIVRAGGWPILPSLECV